MSSVAVSCTVNWRGTRWHCKMSPFLPRGLLLQKHLPCFCRLSEGPQPLVCPLLRPNRLARNEGDSGQQGSLPSLEGPVLHLSPRPSAFSAGQRLLGPSQSLSFHRPDLTWRLVILSACTQSLRAATAHGGEALLDILMAGWVPTCPDYYRRGSQPALAQICWWVFWALLQDPGNLSFPDWGGQPPPSLASPSTWPLLWGPKAPADLGCVHSLDERQP